MQDAANRPAPFVCFGGVDWWYHSRAHSDVQLMLALARERRVLFVNSIGMRMPTPGRSTGVLGKIVRKLKSTMRWLRQPREDLPNFAVLSPLVLPFYGSATMRKLNAWLVRTQVRHAMRKLGMDTPHVVVTVPTAWTVAKDMARLSLTYNRSDKHSAFAEADPALIQSLEFQLLAHADRVIYASEQLLRAERDYTGARATFLDHGVDLTMFSPQSGPPPADIDSIPHPRIGFFGSLRGHLVDLELLEHAARSLPDAQFVLVGAAPSSIDALAALPNVHWLGAKEHDEIPAYGRAFDIGLMPYRANEWIDACNPIKLKEYLALGLPIVSTDFPAARRYDGLIDVAADRDAFVAAIRRVLSEPIGPELSARLAAVADSSWEARARSLLQLVTSE